METSGTSGKVAVEGHEVGQVEPAVERRHRGSGDSAQQRELHEVDVEVQDVEVLRALADLLQHQQVVRQRIAHRRVEAERGGGAFDQPGARLGIAAGEEGDVVALRHQLLGQVGDDALGAAVEPGRDALGQGRDLGDLHGWAPRGRGILRRPS